MIILLRDMYKMINVQVLKNFKKSLKLLQKVISIFLPKKRYRYISQYLRNQMSHTILLYQYRKRTTGPFQKYKYHFCGIIIMKDTDKRIKVCFCCQKIQNFQASLHCFMQNLNIYNFMNFSSQNNHANMIFICTERSCYPLSKMVKQNTVRHLVPEILIDISVSFFRQTVM